MEVHLNKLSNGAVLLTIDGYTAEEKEYLELMAKYNVHVTAFGESGSVKRLQILSNNVDDPVAGFTAKAT